MKKIIILCLMAFLTIGTFAQSDVISFLGIPVQGSKAEMREKLIAKGFRPSPIPGEDCLVGEFNGERVKLHIQTNNDKVYRIALYDARKRSEVAIKQRFNKLIDQFKAVPQYISYESDYVQDALDLHYELTVRKKIVKATFYLSPDLKDIDATAAKKKILSDLLTKFTIEELQDPTPEMEKEIEAMVMKSAIASSANKMVWFSINENHGEYIIAMYFENKITR